MKLTEVAGKIAQQAYQEQAATEGNKNTTDDGGPSSSKDAVDAEFEEVDDKKDEPKENSK